MTTFIVSVVVGVFVLQLIGTLVYGVDDDTEQASFTVRERLENIRDIWTDARARKEVRLTAISWNPDEHTDCHDYQEDCSVSQDKPREFYRVIRRGRK